MVHEIDQDNEREQAYSPRLFRQLLHTLTLPAGVTTNIVPLFVMLPLSEANRLRDFARNIVHYWEPAQTGKFAGYFLWTTI